MAAQSPLDKEIQVIIIAILAASYFRFLVGNRALGAVTMGGLCERFAIKFYSNGKKLILTVLSSFRRLTKFCSLYNECRRLVCKERGGLLWKLIFL